MKAVLMPYGFIVGGPKNAVWVPTQAGIEPAITNMMAIDNASRGDNAYDRDDYTATEVFMKGWQGSVLDLEDKAQLLPRNWDKSYKEQP